MIDTEQRVGQVMARLRERGYRMTPQRAAIVNAMVSSEHHPNAEQVYAEVRELFPMMSLATVYKTIGVLRDLHEVAELPVSCEGVRFDARRPDPHPHLICSRCGDVIDVAVENVERLVRQVSESTGYDIVGYPLQLWGICPRCRAES
jgi:Fur family peroxide stress response transcriptional regulator